MIGMACKNACGAIQLFHQHGPCQQVRPGCRAERQQQIGFGPLLLGMAVRRADHKTGFSDAVVAPAPESLCKFLRSERLAPLVQQNGLEGSDGIGDPSAGFGQFGKTDRPGHALFITRDQLSFGRAGNLTASDDVKQNDGLIRSLESDGPLAGRKADRPPGAMRPKGRVSEDIAARRRCDKANYARPAAASLPSNDHMRSRL